MILERGLIMQKGIMNNRKNNYSVNINKEGKFKKKAKQNYRTEVL